MSSQEYYTLIQHLNEFSRRWHTWERFISTSILNSSNITVVKQTSISPLWASARRRSLTLWASALRLANFSCRKTRRCPSITVSTTFPANRSRISPSAALIWSLREDITSRTKRYSEYILVSLLEIAQWSLLTSHFWSGIPIFLWDKRDLLLLKDDPFAAKIRRLLARE